MRALENQIFTQLIIDILCRVSVKSKRRVIYRILSYSQKINRKLILF